MRYEVERPRIKLVTRDRESDAELLCHHITHLFICLYAVYTRVVTFHIQHSRRTKILHVDSEPFARKAMQLMVEVKLSKQLMLSRPRAVTPLFISYKP